MAASRAATFSCLNYGRRQRMYRAPLRELRFVLEELLQSQALAAYAGLATTRPSWPRRF